VTESALAVLVPAIGAAAACRAVGRSRATHHRRHRKSPAPAKAMRPRRPQPRSLSDEERQGLLEVLHSGRFCDVAPAEVWATLIDEGVYLASVPTMYRALRAHGEIHERRRQRSHPATVKPELVATAPNRGWSWDITKLLGPEKWTYYYLYVILDIFSRYAVGWMVASVESAELAKRLIAGTCSSQRVARDTLTIHADRGSSMASKPVAHLLADLGVTKSHSRPHVSNDNPFSESQFKTFKYRPDFPGRFGCIEDARAHCQRFFRWYNFEHRHAGIALLTPADVHHGRAGEVIAARAHVLMNAYAANPERFVRRPPAPRQLPVASWINKPDEKEDAAH
jgi:putative transposase